MIFEVTFWYNLWDGPDFTINQHYECEVRDLNDAWKLFGDYCFSLYGRKEITLKDIKMDVTKKLL